MNSDFLDFTYLGHIDDDGWDTDFDFEAFWEIVDDIDAITYEDNPLIREISLYWGGGTVYLFVNSKSKVFISASTNFFGFVIYLGDVIKCVPEDIATKLKY
ncbi:MAG: hypothetical protein K2L15_02460 [Eubacteriales bacterium]|nr:hypothetical protein [Eubacteriales bacterium]